MDLQTILELMDQIQSCRTGDKSEAWGRTLGEMDAVAELHRIIDNDRPQEWWK